MGPAELAGQVRARAGAARREPLVRVRAASRLLAPYRRRQFQAFGSRSVLWRPDWLYGTHRIAVGQDVLILPGAWLAVERTAWEADGPVLTIGDRVAMRTNCALSAACSVVVEDDVVFGGSVTVVDSDHTWDAGHPNVLYNPVDAAPVRIGRGSWLADRVTVTRGARIGAFCMIGANSVVTGDVPDGSVAVGAPARVVGRTRAPA